MFLKVTYIKDNLKNISTFFQIYLQVFTTGGRYRSSAMNFQSNIILILLVLVILLY